MRWTEIQATSLTAVASVLAVNCACFLGRRSTLNIYVLSFRVAWATNNVQRGLHNVELSRVFRPAATYASDELGSACDLTLSRTTTRGSDENPYERTRKQVMAIKVISC